MDNEEFWTNFVSLLPSNVEADFSGSECTVKMGDKEVKIVREDNSFVVNKKTLHFKDEPETVNTLLVPYVLQELDGQRRI